jgi:hypothetical protein
MELFMFKPMTAAALSFALVTMSPSPTPGATNSPPIIAPKPTLDAAESAVLQGDGPAARAALQSINIGRLSPKDQLIHSCMLDRLKPEFVAGPMPGLEDGFARDVLTAYRFYWHRALLLPEQREAAKSELVAKLLALLGQPNLTDEEAIVSALSERLSAIGLNSSWGKTGHLYELMIWKNEVRADVDIELPSGKQKAKLVLLDDMPSAGWSRYATCGSIGTGAWATDDALFAVFSVYDGLDSEDFHVNFLSHETQHFYDKNRYGDKLLGWQLEFRAKLVELVYAKDTLRETIDAFANNQSDTIDDPHSYANKRVLAAMRTRLRAGFDTQMKGLQQARISQAARAILAENTRELDRQFLVRR